MKLDTGELGEEYRATRGDTVKEECSHSLFSVRNVFHVAVPMPQLCYQVDSRKVLV